MIEINNIKREEEHKMFFSFWLPILQAVSNVKKNFVKKYLIPTFGVKGIIYLNNVKKAI
jgi:hypothetical protein